MHAPHALEEPIKVAGRDTVDQSSIAECLHRIGGIEYEESAAWPLRATRSTFRRGEVRGHRHQHGAARRQQVHDAVDVATYPLPLVHSSPDSPSRPAIAAAGLAATGGDRRGDDSLPRPQARRPLLRSSPRFRTETLGQPVPKIHASAIVETGATVGHGSQIWHHAHVREGASVGEGCTLGKNVFVDAGVEIGNRVKIQNNVSIYAGVTVEDDVFVGPSAVFTNDRVPRAHAGVDWEIVPTRVRSGASIGANATIVAGVEIGSHSLVGAGAVVTRPVPSHGLVFGNPARLQGWVCRCGRTRVAVTASGSCENCRTQLPPSLSVPQ